MVSRSKQLMEKKRIAKVPGLVRKLYKTLGTLSELFEDRPFTLDGHPVGSVGEVLVAYHYDLTLLGPSAKKHDAKTRGGKSVQIKATQGNRGVALRSKPDHLIVVHLDSKGAITEIYNGPGAPAWKQAGSPSKSNGQRFVSITKLKGLMTSTPESKRIRRTCN